MRMSKENRESEEQEVEFPLPVDNKKEDFLAEGVKIRERQSQDCHLVFDEGYQNSNHKNLQQIDAKPLISPIIKGEEHCRFKLRVSKINPIFHSKASQDKSSLFNQASKVSVQNLQKKGFKNVKSYDQLRDKNLIQYLYTRQNKIFEPESIPFNDSQNCKTEHIKTRKLTTSPLTKMARKLKLSRRENQPFQVKNDRERKMEYNVFDAFGCEQSLKQKNDSKHHKNTRNEEHLSQKTEKTELVVFKERINRLQESVYHKVPFLMQMGVKFKYRQ